MYLNMFSVKVTVSQIYQLIAWHSRLEWWYWKQSGHYTMTEPALLAAILCVTKTWPQAKYLGLNREPLNIDWGWHKFKIVVYPYHVCPYRPECRQKSRLVLNMCLDVPEMFAAKGRSVVYVDWKIWKEWNSFSHLNKQILGFKRRGWSHKQIKCFAAISSMLFVSSLKYGMLRFTLMLECFDLQF